jgi:hypothetical protein
VILPRSCASSLGKAFILKGSAEPVAEFGRAEPVVVPYALPEQAFFLTAFAIPVKFGRSHQSSPFHVVVCGMVLLTMVCRAFLPLRALLTTVRVSNWVNRERT